MKNEWLIPLIKSLEEKKFNGKLILNFSDGDVPKVRKEEEIQKDSSLKR
jgi:hypothetical protein